MEESLPVENGSPRPMTPDTMYADLLRRPPHPHNQCCYPDRPGVLLANFFPLRIVLRKPSTLSPGGRGARGLLANFCLEIILDEITGRLSSINRSAVLTARVLSASVCGSVVCVFTNPLARTSLQATLPSFTGFDPNRKSTQSLRRSV